MDHHHCPACQHPVPLAAWPEATSLSEAVLGRNVQIDWIEMRRCPSCDVLLRRAASEQWQPVAPSLIAALQGGSPSEEAAGSGDGRAGDALPARATEDIQLASREIIDEARQKCAEARRIQERSRQIRRAGVSPPQQDRERLPSPT
jgi:hypothetical protein